MIRLFAGLSGLALALLVAAPLLVIVAAALFPPGSVPDAGQWWPESPSLASLARAWQLADMGPALGWSLLIAGGGMLLSLLVASLSAVGLRLASARTRRWLLVALVLAASVPYTALWLPRFLLFRELGLHDTPLPLLAPALLGGGPLLVLLYVFSLRHVPPAHFEAGRIEGLGPLGLWWRVALPQLHGTTLAAGFLSFAWFWGNTLDPLIYLRSGEVTTAPLALLGLELLGSGELPVWLAGAAWLMLPILLLLLLLLPWLKSLETR